jgi:hypothetical protein
MKRLLSLFLLILTLLFVTSCIKPDNTVLPPEEQSPTVTEVEEAYQRATEAFYWFAVTTMPTEDFNSANSSTYMEADGMVYAKVKHDTIKNHADLEKYLHSLFADDIVSGLLSRDGEIQRYRDFDGALYAILADRGTDIYKGEEILTVTQESAEQFVCTVEVELLGEDNTVIGYETHQYFYEQVDGQWVFTNFYLFR